MPARPDTLQFAQQCLDLLAEGRGPSEVAQILGTYKQKVVVYSRLYAEACTGMSFPEWAEGKNIRRRYRKGDAFKLLKVEVGLNALERRKRLLEVKKEDLIGRIALRLKLTYRQARALHLIESAASSSFLLVSEETEPEIVHTDSKLEHATLEDDFDEW